VESGLNENIENLLLTHRLTQVWSVLRFQEINITREAYNLSGSWYYNFRRR